ncbi:MAG: M64 family metallo-endopeptidase [Prolixibacteraceae bacterium]|jgi:hypothetical protein|nr:M64 family metallo-endopeptidase [Prolixibacteraceae bacterium]
MKTILFPILIFFLFSQTVTGQSNFHENFLSGAVRYDYELVGNANYEEVIPVQIKYLKEWGGNPNFLIEDLNYGSYNYQILDNTSDSLLFQKGFSNLFWEWQSTIEAKTRKQTFYQSLFFPRPINDVKIVINKRDSLNNWVPIFTDEFKVNNYFIVQENRFSFEIDTILNNGKAADNVDIVLLSEGYTKTEMTKYLSDARRMIKHLLSVAPFNNYSDKFNVYAVKVPSVESGTDVPGSSIYKNTAFDSHFYTFDSPRYLTTSNMKSVYDAIDGVAWDQIYILVNTERYGGGGFYNFLNVCTSDNERSEFVFCHEFGHGFAALGDEYYTSDTSYEDFLNKAVELWEPNLTTLVNFERKWGSMISSDTPIPTPRDSIYVNTVGVFEGGGYEAKGVYSPVMECWMKVHTANGFCPVCTNAIRKMIMKHSN